MIDCFFFQAEDGIRDYKVTGVQTCALPIWSRLFGVGFASPDAAGEPGALVPSEPQGKPLEVTKSVDRLSHCSACRYSIRSEERRVGKERRYRRATARDRERQREV